MWRWSLFFIVSHEVVCTCVALVRGQKVVLSWPFFVMSNCSVSVGHLFQNFFLCADLKTWHCVEHGPSPFSFLHAALFTCQGHLGGCHQLDKTYSDRNTIMIIMTAIVVQCFTTTNKTCWKWFLTAVAGLIIAIKNTLLCLLRLFVLGWLLSPKC